MGNLFTSISINKSLNSILSSCLLIVVFNVIWGFLWPLPGCEYTARLLWFTVNLLPEWALSYQQVVPLKDDQVVSDDGDGGTTWQLQLPPTAGASGGQHCWTCWADRRVPHNCKVCSYSYTPEGCHVKYNPCHFCPILLLPNVAEKQKWKPFFPSSSF